MYRTIHNAATGETVRLPMTPDQIAQIQPATNDLAKDLLRAVARKRVRLEREGLSIAGETVRLHREDAMAIQAVAMEIREENEHRRAESKPADYMKRVKLASGAWTPVDAAKAQMMRRAVNARIDALDAAQEAHEKAIEQFRVSGDRAALEAYDVSSGWPV